VTYVRPAPCRRCACGGERADSGHGPHRSGEEPPLADAARPTPQHGPWAKALVDLRHYRKVLTEEHRRLGIRRHGAFRALDEAIQQLAKEELEFAKAFVKGSERPSTAGEHDEEDMPPPQDEA
jgi:hypothetical protein